MKKIFILFFVCLLISDMFSEELRAKTTAECLMTREQVEPKLIELLRKASPTEYPSRKYTKSEEEKKKLRKLRNNLIFSTEACELEIGLADRWEIIADIVKKHPELLDAALEFFLPYSIKSDKIFCELYVKNAMEIYPYLSDEEKKQNIIRLMGVSVSDNTLEALKALDPEIKKLGLEKDKEYQKYLRDVNLHIRMIKDLQSLSKSPEELKKWSVKQLKFEDVNQPETINGVSFNDYYQERLKKEGMERLLAEEMLESLKVSGNPLEFEIAPLFAGIAEFGGQLYWMAEPVNEMSRGRYKLGFFDKTGKLRYIVRYSGLRDDWDIITLLGFYVIGFFYDDKGIPEYYIATRVKPYDSPFTRYLHKVLYNLKEIPESTKKE